MVVVRTAELPPYKAVEQAFQSSIGQPVESMSLATGSPQDLVKAVLAKNPSLAFVIGAGAAKAFQDAGSPVPLLYALIPDPARMGLPPRSGVPMFASPASQARTIKAAIPRATKVGMIYDPRISKALVDECEAAARALGMSLVRVEVASQKEVISQARELFSKVDAFWLIPDTTVVSVDTFKFIALTSLETKVPLVGFSEASTLR